jgi:hypothetical protein
MENNRYRRLMWCFTLSFLTVALVMGCGVKKDPKPPKAWPPAGVADLTYELDGDQVFLSWAMVGEENDDTAETAGFYVFRSRISLAEPECPKCPILFDRIGEISFDQSQRGTWSPEQGKGQSFDEPLEKGYRYIYKVSAYAESGLLGPESNSVEFTY